MASESIESQQLLPKQIVCLARVITVENMESIAEGYFGIEHETIKNLKYENNNNAEAFNKSVIRHWMYQNSTGDQIQVGWF